MSSFVILDAKETNPAFFYELKRIYKKDPAFTDIYENTVRAFLFDLAAAKTTETIKPVFFGVISHAVTLSSYPNEGYRIVKFRAKTKNKSGSESPRLCTAIVSVRNIIIPLTIYTHGETKKEPQIKTLTELMFDILKTLL